MDFTKTTEQDSHYNHLEKKSISNLLAAINNEDETVPKAVKKAIPELNEYHHKFSEKLVIIGLSDESKGKVKRMKKPKMEYFSAIDTKERLKQIYEVKGIPHCVIINPNGIVVWEGWPHQKGFELTEETIDNLIKNY